MSRFLRATVLFVLFPPLAAVLALGTGSSPGAQAQGTTALSATVIVSDLGTAAPRGRLERRVAEAWSVRRTALGGIFGQALDLTIRSDAGDPLRAERLAREAVEDGAHALVCCTTPAASGRVAAVAAAGRIPLLSPAGPGEASAVGWQFALAPSDRVQLQAAIRDAYARGMSGLGFMAPEGAFGDAAEEALAQLVAAPTMSVIARERYPLDADVLTPEALAVATREPGAILAWGLRDDTALAVAGLRARGWDGPVYVRGALADPAAGGLPPGLSGDVRLGIPPAVLEDALDPSDPRASWIADARSLGGGQVGSTRGSAEGAVMHDALVLLARAFEQASVYGVSPEDTARYRLALRDALVSLGPVHLAAGTYDPSMASPDAALAEGLTMARLVGGTLAPLP